MLIQDIANKMSDLEAQALEAFQGCAQGFDAFNKGAANVVRDLLKINADLQEENNQLRIEIYRLRDVDVDSIKIGRDPYAHADGSRECRPVDFDDSKMIGGTD